MKQRELVGVYGLLDQEKREREMERELKGRVEA